MAHALLIFYWKVFAPYTRPAKLLLRAVPPDVAQRQMAIARASAASSGRGDLRPDAAAGGSSPSPGAFPPCRSPSTALLDLHRGVLVQWACRRLGDGQQDHAAGHRPTPMAVVMWYAPEIQLLDRDRASGAVTCASRPDHIRGTGPPAGWANGSSAGVVMAPYGQQGVKRPRSRAEEAAARGGVPRVDP